MKFSDKKLAQLFRITLQVMGGVLLWLVASPASAILINPTYSGFSAGQQSVIQGAINQWQGLVGGRHEIAIDFSVDNSIAAGATTSGWVTDSQGRPTNVDVVVRESAFNWATGSATAGTSDAMHAISHEISHSIGWTVGLANFSSNVRTDSGNRYYDIDGNSSFSSAADFDLIDNASSGTHAPSGSNDLMQPVAPVGQRFIPNIRHAAVLTDAFGYDVVLNALGGPAGYGDLAIGRNDDGSSARLNLPFEIDIFGDTYNNFFINNNGNLTFDSSLFNYTPDSFPIANQPMIAPYWGDVDTRCASCGEVYVASPNDETVVVTWDNVGYYNRHADLTNTFQTVIRDRSDTGAGNFDFEFRFGNLEWTTGDASGGSGGLGGTPAQSGFDAGDLTNFFALPGSRTAAVLNLENTTNLTPEIPGIWSFAVRNGETPGSTPDNPLLPVVAEDGFNFDFNIGDINDQIFIDPILAIGYDYIVNSGPNIQTVLLPTGIGDNFFDLWLFDTGLNAFIDSGTDLLGGVSFDFGTGGVDRFRILGIETSAGLDPSDVTAFVTGLTFTGTGPINLSQNPITFDTDTVSTPVPEPSTLSLIFVGLIGVIFIETRRRHKEKKHG